MPYLPDAPRRRLFVIGSFVEAHCWTVARLPGRDESQQASSYVRECAGKGLAVALGAHRLGAAVDLLMAVGHDAAGDALLQRLAREGLDAAHVHRLGPHSGQGCGLTGAQGETTVTVHPGANALLGARELRLAAHCIQQAAVAYAQCEAPLPLVADALRMAQAGGAATVLNPSPWPQGCCDELLAAASILVVNRKEAAALLRHLGCSQHGAPGHAPNDLLNPLPRLLWSQWPGQWLVITLGAQGCVAHARSGAVLCEAGRRVNASQPIGAGDAFAAGLCAALALGKPMAQALRAANACGALAASCNGILDALPHQGAVDALQAS